MERSSVYVHLNFLTSLREIGGRRLLLQNMTSSQTKAVCEVVKRLVDVTINPLRRDVHALERKRTALRTLASDRVSVSRKKAIMRRNHSLIPIILRERYVIVTIADELE